MKKFKFLLLALVMILSLIGCTQQEMVKNYGGEMTVYLEPNVKLVNVTWKDDNLWYLTKPMTDNDIVETYNFEEESSYGIWEGTVTIIESKATEEELKNFEKLKEEYIVHNWEEYLYYTKEKGYTLQDVKSSYSENYNE